MPSSTYKKRLFNEIKPSLTALIVSASKDFSAELEFTDLAFDSRRVVPGAIFFAINGQSAKGLDFIPQAIERGAGLIISEEKVSASVPSLQVSDIRLALAVAATCFYNFPTQSTAVDLIAVTGTNGKTSVSWILAHLLSLLGEQVGLSGTLGRGRIELAGLQPEFAVSERDLTTPDPLSLQAYFASEIQQGATKFVFEASSHALIQRRLDGVELTAAIFTNLTRDHLDYHASESEYFSAKARLFTELLKNSDKPDRFAVISIDSAYGEKLKSLLVKEPMLKVYTTSIHKPADFYAIDIKLGAQGMAFKVLFEDKEFNFEARLTGLVNVENLLAAIACACGLGFRMEDIVRQINLIPAVPGRFERVLNKPAVFVDYAHTPDALERSLNALREITLGQLICVFGCGGERDQGKRADMGQIAEKFADKIIVTSDNPRSEAPARIIDDILSGMQSSEKVQTIENRKQAIQEALLQLKADDVLLIAGKGHEDYQEINGVRLPFSDQQLCREIASNLGYV